MKVTQNTATWTDLCATLARATHKFHEDGCPLDLISAGQFRRLQRLVFKELDKTFLGCTNYVRRSPMETERADVSDIVIEVMNKIPTERQGDRVTIAEYHVFRARLMRELQEMWDR
jgi:hypothetical protein